MENRFQSIFDHVNEGILIANRSGEIVAINPMGRTMFGIGAGEVNLGMVEDLVPLASRGRHEAHRMQYHEHPHARPMGKNMMLYGLKRTGETFPVEISLSTYESEGQMFVIAFIIDVTERREQEEKIKSAYNELQLLNNSLEKKVRDRTMVLEEALADLKRSKDDLFFALERERELNELKSRFVSTASHEFRTPLSTILSSVALIEQYAERKELDKIGKHIHRVKHSVKGLTEILEDILSLSKLEEGKIQLEWKMIHFENWLNECLDELAPILKEGQTFKLDYRGPHEVCSDPKVLKNIVVNLLSNAVKFSPENSQISIAVKEENGKLKLIFEDQGIGIPSSELEHLFQRFHRASNVVNIQGTGLGLSIVKKCVELLGGSIFVESTISKGTKFIIHLDSEKYGKENHLDH